MSVLLKAQNRAREKKHSMCIQWKIEMAEMCVGPNSYVSKCVQKYIQIRIIQARLKRDSGGARRLSKSKSVDL